MIFDCIQSIELKFLIILMVTYLGKVSYDWNCLKLMIFDCIQSIELKFLIILIVNCLGKVSYDWNC